VTTLLAFVFVIGVLVFVHELGHYLAARRVGVRVITFSLGFGPRILSTTRGGTEYCIAAIPLGGYVKMAGESGDEERSGQPDEFLSKSKWERFQILIMGPAMNIALAILLGAVVLMNGVEVPAYLERPADIGSIAPGSPAERAGLAVGDRIVDVDGRGIDTWEQAEIEIASRPKRDIPMTVLREGRKVALSIHPDAEGDFEIGRIGVFPNAHPIIQSVNAGDPADRAGLKRGDVVTAVDGRPVNLGSQLSEAISKSPERPITLTLQRGDQTLEVPVTPRKNGDIGWIGISMSIESRRIDPGPLQAFRMSLERSWEMTTLILRTLWGLITGQTSPKQLMGPVGIAQLSGESAEQGWVALLGLMATISLNLGLLNLMPIPVLDGGHIVILALEGVARRNFSMRVKERMLLAGFVLLLLLMVTVIYNDLTRIGWVENLMFWR
jgi:regulator of sigma E protease